MDAVEILEHFFFVIVVVWFVIYFFGNAKLHFFFEKPKQNYRKKGKKVTKRKKVLCRNYKIKKLKTTILTYKQELSLRYLSLHYPDFISYLISI